jgi:hypothetical protein
LLDNNVPRGLGAALTGHAVTEARERGWATFKNGDLLTVAEKAGFEVLVRLVVLTAGRWTILRRMLREIAAAVDAAAPGSYAEVEVPSE